MSYFIRILYTLDTLAAEREVDEWVGFNVSTTTVYRSSGRQFYRSKTQPTASHRVLKEKKRQVPECVKIQHVV